MLFDKYRCLSKTTIMFIPADSPYIHSWTFNILHSGVRVSFVFFILLTARFRGMFRDAPLFPTMATPLEKALFSKGSRCRGSTLVQSRFRFRENLTCDPAVLYSLSNVWHRLQIRGVNKQNLTLHGVTKGYFNNGLRTRTRTQWTREDMKGRKPFLSSSLTRPNSHISLPLQTHRLQISGVKKQALA